jgi:hypothetical protein
VEWKRFDIENDIVSRILKKIRTEDTVTKNQGKSSQNAVSCLKIERNDECSDIERLRVCVGVGGWVGEGEVCPYSHPFTLTSPHSRFSHFS